MSSQYSPPEADSVSSEALEQSSSSHCDSTQGSGSIFSSECSKLFENNSLLNDSTASDLTQHHTQEGASLAAAAASTPALSAESTTTPIETPSGDASAPSLSDLPVSPPPPRRRTRMNKLAANSNIKQALGLERRPRKGAKPVSTFQIGQLFLFEDVAKKDVPPPTIESSEGSSDGQQPSLKGKEIQKSEDPPVVEVKADDGKTLNTDVRSQLCSCP